MNAFRMGLVTAAALSALAAGSARADDPDHHDPYRDMVSTRARAEVAAERDVAIRNGTIAELTGEDSGSIRFASVVPSSVLTRAQVQRDVIASRRDGTLGALFGEDGGSFNLDGPQPVYYAGGNWMARTGR